jgi:hypothetical protein
MAETLHGAGAVMRQRHTALNPPKFLGSQDRKSVCAQKGPMAPSCLPLSSFHDYSSDQNDYYIRLHLVFVALTLGYNLRV